jgi:hypothetical protein
VVSWFHISARPLLRRRNCNISSRKILRSISKVARPRSFTIHRKMIVDRITTLCALVLILSSASFENVVPTVEAFSVVKSTFSPNSLIKSTSLQRRKNSVSFRANAVALNAGNVKSDDFHLAKPIPNVRSRAWRLWPLTLRLAISRLVWRLLRKFSAFLRHYWKGRLSHLPSWRQVNEAQKAFRSSVCYFFVALMIIWNTFFTSLSPIKTDPASSHQQHHFSKPVMSILTSARSKSFHRAFSKSDDLLAGHSIQIEKEREIMWQLRERKEFCWDAIPEGEIFGVSYHSSPRMVLHRIVIPPKVPTATVKDEQDSKQSGNS